MQQCVVGIIVLNFFHLHLRHIYRESQLHPLRFNLLQNAMESNYAYSLRKHLPLFDIVFEQFLFNRLMRLYAMVLHNYYFLN